MRGRRFIPTSEVRSGIYRVADADRIHFDSRARAAFAASIARRVRARFGRIWIPVASARSHTVSGNIDHQYVPGEPLLSRPGLVLLGETLQMLSGVEPGRRGATTSPPKAATVSASLGGRTTSCTSEPNCAPKVTPPHRSVSMSSRGSSLREGSKTPPSPSGEWGCGYRPLKTQSAHDDSSKGLGWMKFVKKSFGKYSGTRDLQASRPVMLPTVDDQREFQLFECARCGSDMNAARPRLTSAKCG